MCYRYAQRWVDAFHEDQQMIAFETPLYLKSLHNLLNTLFNLWHYERFMDALQKFEAAKSVLPLEQVVNMEGLYYLYYYTHQINKHYMQGTYSEGISLVPQLMDIISSEQYNWDDHRLMLFYYKVACLYFGSNNNSKAIDYLNLIINQKNPDYRQDIQSFARILSLIAHFELGNERLVEYQIKSVYRFLGKMKDLHQVQQEIFRFLRRTPKMRANQLKQEFIDLKTKLEEIKRKPYEGRPFLYLDIISW
ncbi:MAG: hypothetical protein HC912_11130, partial [Saprospiraceae bacterium]|nr:hypothetical protein [Saprospiraceae bacterium]